jgi:F0F1-type ATP synthase beta subunit
MTQLISAAEDQTGRPGVFVNRKDTVTDVEAILAGKFDNVPADRLMYIGTTADLLAGKNKTHLDETTN